MYQNDYKAQGVVLKAVYNNYHKYLSPLECIFLPCLVLTHSENLHLQELCVEIWSNYVMSKVSGSNRLFVIFDGLFRHKLSVIQRFGRFPHRNKLLGRNTTEE